jgi:hypothetical protein
MVPFRHLDGSGQTFTLFLAASNREQETKYPLLRQMTRLFSRHPSVMGHYNK